LRGLFSARISPFFCFKHFYVTTNFSIFVGVSTMKQRQEFQQKFNNSIENVGADLLQQIKRL